jgi:hypothetical protein
MLQGKAHPCPHERPPRPTAADLRRTKIFLTTGCSRRVQLYGHTGTITMYIAPVSSFGGETFVGEFFSELGDKQVKMKA